MNNSTACLPVDEESGNTSLGTGYVVIGLHDVVLPRSAGQAVDVDGPLHSSRQGTDCFIDKPLPYDRHNYPLALIATSWESNQSFHWACGLIDQLGWLGGERIRAKSHTSSRRLGMLYVEYCHISSVVGGVRPIIHRKQRIGSNLSLMMRLKIKSGR